MNPVPETIRASADRLVRELGTEAARQLVRDAGAKAAERYIVETERRRVIRAMRAEHKSRAEIRTALVRKGVSRTVAYELIADELFGSRPETGRARANIDR